MKINKYKFKTVRMKLTQAPKSMSLIAKAFTQGNVNEFTSLLPELIKQEIQSITPLNRAFEKFTPQISSTNFNEEESNLFVAIEIDGRSMFWYECHFKNMFHQVMNGSQYGKHFIDLYGEYPPDSKMELPRPSTVDECIRKYILPAIQLWWTIKALEKKRTLQSRVDIPKWKEWMKRRGNEVMTIFIMELPLSNHTLNRLHYAEIETLSEVIKLTKEDFSKIRGVGPVIVEEFEQFLDFIDQSFAK
jgi:hypothetical protein